MVIRKKLNSLSKHSSEKAQSWGKGFIEMLFTHNINKIHDTHIFKTAKYVAVANL